MDPAMRYQETLRSLAIIDEGFVGAAAGVTGAFGYDIEAALEDRDDS